MRFMMSSSVPFSAFCRAERQMAAQLNGVMPCSSARDSSSRVLNGTLICESWPISGRLMLSMAFDCEISLV